MTPAKAKGNSTPSENGNTIPATMRIKVPANKLYNITLITISLYPLYYVTYIGPIPLKSHLDCKVNKVKAKNTPNVMTSA